jgi:hypothetical protein
MDTIDEWDQIQRNRRRPHDLPFPVISFQPQSDSRTGAWLRSLRPIVRDLPYSSLGTLLRRLSAAQESLDRASPFTPAPYGQRANRHHFYADESYRPTKRARR